MHECLEERLRCQSLLAQLKKSQDDLKSQLYRSSNDCTDPMDMVSSTLKSSNGTSKEQFTGILKPSTSYQRPYSLNQSRFANLNNSANLDTFNGSTIDPDISKATRDELPSNYAKCYSQSSMDNRTNFDQVGGKQAYYDTTDKSFLSTLKPHSETQTSLKTTIESGLDQPLRWDSKCLPMSPTAKNWRQILNRHVIVPSQLSGQELQDLDNKRMLNFSYACAEEVDDANVSGAKGCGTEQVSHHQSQSEVGKTTVCEDITNKPVSLSLAELGNRKANMVPTNAKRSHSKLKQDTGKISSKKVQFFREQLEDEGNSRKLNSFIKETTLKPKSLLNSSAYRSLCPSKQNSSGVELSAEDQRLLGYDWIAAILDNDPGLVDQSESFFNELKDFRRAYKSECSNQFYRESPHNLVEFEPEPVADALKETKVHPFVVNERLFTEPFKSGLFDEEALDLEARPGDKKTPSVDNPRFVRVSIPRSTLSTPYKVKPHRRRSFDGSDSCALMDHCLLGWENTCTAMIPTAKSLDLNTEAGTRVDCQVKTLEEAEKLAERFSQAEWPFSRTTARCNTLPNWKKHYMDTTLNLSRVSADLTNNLSTSSGAGRDVKRSTDQILSATYSAMYEMERLRKQRELEMAVNAEESRVKKS